MSIRHAFHSGCVLALFAVASTAFGRIGDTIEQAIERYGQPNGHRVLDGDDAPKLLQPKPVLYFFKAEGCELWVKFWQGKSVDEEVRKQDRTVFTPSEVVLWVDRMLGDGKWERVFNRPEKPKSGTGFKGGYDSLFNFPMPMYTTGTATASCSTEVVQAARKAGKSFPEAVAGPVISACDRAYGSVVGALLAKQVMEEQTTPAKQTPR